MPDALDPKQWCELHRAHAHDVRAVRVGGAAADRFTVMICTKCCAEINKYYGWIVPATMFKWDYIWPDAQQYGALVRFLR